MPLVYEGLSRSSSNFSGKARSQLRREFRQSATNSFLYAAELVRVSKELQQRQISALAFKGPTLAALLYEKLSLRTVRDLDLLVSRDQVNTALEVLQACGYAPEPGLGGAPPSVSGNVRHHILLVHHNLSFNVELHWALAAPSFVFPLQFEELWAERQTVSVMNQPVATFSREHTLLMMCAHGTSHCWSSLKWICDIAQAILVFSDLDWTRVLALSHDLGCNRMLCVGLTLATELCGVKLPAELESSVSSEKVIRVCREAQERLFADRDPAVNLERTLTFVRSRERLLDRIRILFRFIRTELRPNARDRALVHLPDSLQVLYFPLRFIRLLLFCWKRAILPILQGAVDRVPFRRFAPIPPE